MIDVPIKNNRAILIGTSYYGGKRERQEEVPGVLESLKQMRKALKLIAVVESPLTNRTRISALLQNVDRICQNAEHGLVVYYVGHGILSKEEFYLSLAGTRLECCTATAIPFRLLGELIAKSSAKKKVLILDCCHAQSALRIQNAFQQHLKTEGFFAIGAAGCKELALAGPGNSPTVFTKEFLEALWHPGLASNGAISMEQIGSYLEERFCQLRANDKQNPQVAISTEGVGSKIVLPRTLPLALYRSVVAAAIGVQDGDRLPKRVEDNLQILGLFRQAELADILMRTLKAADKQVDDVLDILNTNAADTDNCEQIIHNGILPLHRSTRRLQDEIDLNTKYGRFCELSGQLSNVVSEFCQEVRPLKGRVVDAQNPFEEARKKYRRRLKAVRQEIERFRDACRKELK